MIDLKNLTRPGRLVVLKLGVVATAVAMVSACAPPSATSGSGGGTSSASGAITIAWESGSKTAMDNAVAEFEKQNPGTTINTQYLTPDQLTTTLPTQLATGGGPDLFRSDNGSGTAKAVQTLANRGLLEPLTGSWTSSVPDSISKNLKVDGKTYGFTPTLTSIGQLLNEDQLKKYGLTPPTTFSGVLDFCRAARAKGTVAYTAAPASGFDAQSVLYALSWQTIYSKNPNFSSDVTSGKLTWANSGWKQAIDDNLAMVKAGCFPDNFTGIDISTAFKQLFSGQTLGMVGYGAFMQYAPKGANFGMYPLPASGNPDESGMIVTPFSAMAMNKNSKNPGLAQKFVDFLASPTENAKFVKDASPSGGLVSPFYKDLPKPTNQIDQQIITYLENGRSDQFPDATFPGATIATTLEQQMQLAMAGKATTGQVLQQVQAAWDQASK